MAETPDEAARATQAQRAAAAHMTGAFTKPSEPPEEARSGVRPRPAMPERETRPDHRPAPAPAVPAPTPGPKPGTNGVAHVGVDALIASAVKELGGSMSPTNVRALITRECRWLEEFLHDKNAGYGNSVLDPMRVFSKTSPIEQLYVRIDDKLSRISRGDLSKGDPGKLAATVDDLQSYLILLKVAWRLGLR